MATKVQIDEVLAANREQQKRTRALNVRCGEALFKVYSQAELQAFLLERLAGARSMAEVTDAEVVRLPLLDHGLIDLVVEENPDKIRVLGEEIAVEYRGSGYAPRVIFREASNDARRWLDLPDEGVKLPGGRLVEVGVGIGSSVSAVASSTNVLQLKEKVREHLNSAQWHSWTAKPVLLPPDFSKDEQFPEITTVQYGECVVTGAALVAFGTLVQRGYRHSNSDPYFDPKWYRSLDEAGKAHEQGAKKFAELRATAIEKEELGGAKETAQQVQTRIKELNDQKGRVCDLEWSLRSELSTRAYAYLPSTVAELEKWRADSEQLIARVEQGLAELTRKEEEEQITRDRMTALLARDYPSCPVCGQAWSSEAGTSCYCIEHEQFDEYDIVFRESRDSDGRQLVVARLSSGRRNQYVILDVLDEMCPELSEVTTRTLWFPPTEAEQELKRQLRDVEFRLEGFDRELEKCEGEYPSRVLMKFELEVERGTLFAIANVRELSVSDTKSNDYVTVKGSVRFVCDPKRCGWLNEPLPQNGQTWVCSIGRMISRDKKGRPIIIANPQMRYDEEARQAIEAEIDEIKAKIVALHTPLAEVSAVAVAVVEVQEHVEDEQPKATVSVDMLAALRAKFRS